MWLPPQSPLPFGPNTMGTFATQASFPGPVAYKDNCGKCEGEGSFWIPHWSMYCGYGTQQCCKWITIDGKRVQYCERVPCGDCWQQVVKW
ncbi:hypothetical protein ABIF68_001632 [Bradyrhizobium japonicum]